MEGVVVDLGSGGQEHGGMMDAQQREVEDDHHMGDGGEKEDDKNYKEGPWDVLEELVLVSGMKEYAETVGGHHEDVHEQQKWDTIESYCCGQLVQRSAPDCHEKWAALSGEFKRIKDFEVNMMQDQKSYWDMTFD